MPRERTRHVERSTEAEAVNERLRHPKTFDYVDAELERATHGQVVVRAKDRPWDVHRQAVIRYYLSPHEPELQHTANQEWDVFLQRLPDRSGKHRHQGGIIIFVVEGSGWSVLEGKRTDWEAGDLLFVPMNPGRVEHQHFNADPTKPASWIAFLYWPFFMHAGSEITQVENSPVFEAWMAKQAERDAAFEAGSKKTTSKAKRGTSA